MDSREVSKAIRKLVRPALKTVGFSRFASRDAWRLGKAKIDVVNFQSFNSYLAETVGCTTYSFSVNLGCHIIGVPTTVLWHWSGDMSRLPKETYCHFRGHLVRSIDQPELQRRDIWYVDPEGRYLEEAVQDAARALLSEGMRWFARLDDPGEVLRLLREDDPTESLWGFGSKGSPSRLTLLKSVDPRHTA